MTKIIPLTERKMQRLIDESRFYQKVFHPIFENCWNVDKYCRLRCRVLEIMVGRGIIKGFS